MRKFLILGALSVVFFAPLVFIPIDAFAVQCDGPWRPGCDLVPACYSGGPYCQACDVLALVNNLLAFAIYFATFVATVMFAYAGFLYVTAAGNTENIKKAHSIFNKVLLGFVFVLTAWLIIDITLSVFTGKGFGPWTTVQCVNVAGVPSPGSTTGTGGEVATGGTASAGRCTGSDCLTQSQAALQLSQCGVSAVSSGNCTDPTNKKCTALGGLKKDTVDDMCAINEALGGGVVVTAATETGHTNKCHNAGTCVDIDVAGTGAPGSYDVEKINAVIEAGKKAGRCLKFEPAPGASCPTGVTECQEVPWATGDGHFSVYECK